jgi:hypothetical protein
VLLIPAQEKSVDKSCWPEEVGVELGRESSTCPVLLLVRVNPPSIPRELLARQKRYEGEWVYPGAVL